jgi:histidinol dehydrogenase
MLKIYDLETARHSILSRTPAQMENFPSVVLEGVERIFGTGVTPPEAVTMIIASIRENGDAALKQWTQTVDKIQIDEFRISPDEITEAYNSTSDRLKQALQTSASRIRAFHERQPIPSWETQVLGGTLGQRFTPIERLGIYVPGGTAPLPSSLLMSVIPAQVAGVRQIVVCTPPNPNPLILAAAYLCNIEHIYQAGGAQAIASLAFGTQTIPQVDKIVGAGNLFVTLAKQQVYGIVGIDGLAGPTETMVIADEYANPRWVAADLLAQAEHDILAKAILLTPNRNLAQRVQAAAAKQIESLSRADIIARSLAQMGGIVLIPDLKTAAAIANEYAPEHLCLSVAQPTVLAREIDNAGGIFIGENSFEVLGDYVAGPSHIMPTGGTARFASPLNVLDFVKLTSMIALDEGTTRQLSPIAAQIAHAEMLTAHAAAAEYREA